MKGRFYVLEGIDGSGKSVQAAMLADRLRSMGRDVLLTSEPRGSALVVAVHKLIEKNRYLPVTEALLYIAARNQHISDVIRPALERGSDVVCDRFFYSTLAYQGSKMLSPAMAYDIQRVAMIYIKPDKTFLLDVDVGTCKRRILARGGSVTEEELSRLRDVRNVYGFM